VSKQTIIVSEIHSSADFLGVNNFLR